MGNISAVICELNPMHRGHKYIFNEAKKDGDTLVAIMSGNFVQRGECALFNKYARARMALECGADLVAELPFPWSCAPAEYFALGAVRIAVELGVDRIVFGSECGDIELLKQAAELSVSDSFLAQVEAEYSENVGYAVARQRAAEKLFPEAEKLFAASNDMLALEYIIKAKKLGFGGELVAVKRFSDEKYISATAIREAVRGGCADSILYSVPEKIRALFVKELENTALISKLWDTEHILFRLGRTYSDTFDSESGIISRIERCAAESVSGREMLELSATKKYTDARIRRAALFAIMGITKKQLSAPPDFTVLLAADEKGRAVLSNMRRKDGFTVITKPSSSQTVNGWEKQTEADRLYTLLFERTEKASYFIKAGPYIR